MSSDSISQKPRLSWTDDLQEIFSCSIFDVGLKFSTPENLKLLCPHLNLATIESLQGKLLKLKLFRNINTDNSTKAVKTKESVQIFNSTSASKKSRPKFYNTKSSNLKVNNSTTSSNTSSVQSEAEISKSCSQESLFQEYDALQYLEHMQYIEEQQDIENVNKRLKSSDTYIQKLKHEAITYEKNIDLLKEYYNAIKLAINTQTQLYNQAVTKLTHEDPLKNIQPINYIDNDADQPCNTPVNEIEGYNSMRNATNAYNEFQKKYPVLSTQMPNHLDVFNSMNTDETMNSTNFSHHAGDIFNITLGTNILDGVNSNPHNRNSNPAPHDVRSDLHTFSTEMKSHMHLHRQLLQKREDQLKMHQQNSSINNRPGSSCLNGLSVNNIATTFINEATNFSTLPHTNNHEVESFISTSIPSVNFEKSKNRFLSSPSSSSSNTISTGRTDHEFSVVDISPLDSATNYDITTTDIDDAPPSRKKYSNISSSDEKLNKKYELSSNIETTINHNEIEMDEQFLDDIDEGLFSFLFE